MNKLLNKLFDNASIQRRMSLEEALADAPNERKQMEDALAEDLYYSRVIENESLADAGLGYDIHAAMDAERHYRNTQYWAIRETLTCGKTWEQACEDNEVDTIPSSL